MLHVSYERIKPVLSGPPPALKSQVCLISSILLSVYQRHCSARARCGVCLVLNAHTVVSVNVASAEILLGLAQTLQEMVLLRNHCLLLVSDACFPHRCENTVETRGRWMHFMIKRIKPLTFPSSCS